MREWQQSHSPKTFFFVCVDCNQEFEKSAKANAKIRCDDCAVIYRQTRTHKKSSVERIRPIVPNNRKRTCFGEDYNRAHPRRYETYMASNPIYAHFVDPKKYPMREEAR